MFIVEGGSCMLSKNMGYVSERICWVVRQRLGWMALQSTTFPLPYAKILARLMIKHLEALEQLLVITGLKLPKHTQMNMMKQIWLTWIVYSLFHERNTHHCFVQHHLLLAGCLTLLWLTQHLCFLSNDYCGCGHRPGRGRWRWCPRWGADHSAKSCIQSPECDWSQTYQVTTQSCKTKIFLNPYLRIQTSEN